VLAPFLYQQILWMTLFGWWVFGDVPGLPVIAGTAVVIASGLYLIARERRGSVG
jgi:drug/metabolite transporter (DMT)-like permease